MHESSLRREPHHRKLGRRPRLDGVRGIAVLMVLAYHMFPHGARGGFLGVDLFFTLSGFLITCLLVDEYVTTGRISFRDFFARRALRLMPALWVALALFLVLGFSAYSGEDRIAIEHFVVGSALDFANIAVLAGWPFWASHTWSLSLEEQFYLLWPPMLALLMAGIAARRIDLRRLVMVLVFAGVLSALMRTGLWAARGWFTPYYFPASHVDGIIWGCALGIGWTLGLGGDSVRPARIARWAAPVCVVLLLAATVAVARDASFLYLGGYTVIVAACVVLVLSATSAPSSPTVDWIASRPLRFFGRISYALYIWSGLLLAYFEGGVGMRVLGGAVCVAAATASFIVVERPALRVKRRFARAPASVDAVLAPATP